MKSAEEAFAEFQADYKDWDCKYFPLVMAEIHAGKSAVDIRREAEAAKMAMLGRWFQPSSLKRLKALRGNEDPPAFDPDRDEVIVQSRSDAETILLHQQRDGLEAETRVSLVAVDGRWWISGFEMKDFRSGKWSPAEV